MTQNLSVTNGSFSSPTRPAIDVAPAPGVSVRKVDRMGVLSVASDQWFRRPADERFRTVPLLREAVAARRRLSVEAGVALEHVRVQARGSAMQLVTQNGAAADLTHFSFGQLAARAKAPAGYLRTLPAELAQIPLQWSLENAPRDDAKLLVLTPSDVDVPAMVRAVTSPTYGRIWDLDVVDAVMNNCDLTRWKIPAASYATKDPDRATTLYASDRDVFMFLVDDQNAIEVPGEPGHFMFRGFYVSNSETGDAVYSVSTFLYDFVCDNRNIWGVRDFTELRIRHTSGAPDRFIRDATPHLTRYLESSTDSTREMIAASQNKVVGETSKDVRGWLKARGFTGPQITGAMEYAESVPGNPGSLWNLEQGLTAVARDIPHTNDRLDLERKAGALMKEVQA